MPEFWQTRSLGELSSQEWESLCDGCARCCLIKLEDEDSGEVHYTDVVCDLLDLDKCTCSDYPNRHARVPDCIKLTRQTLPEIDWLPATCAYRLIAEGKDLFWWHPLVSGDAMTVHYAGIGVRGRCIPEAEIAEDDLVERMVTWPLSEASFGPDDIGGSTET
jgi:uncharacterized protein